MKGTSPWSWLAQRRGLPAKCTTDDITAFSPVELRNITKPTDTSVLLGAYIPGEGSGEQLGTFAFAEGGGLRQDVKGSVTADPPFVARVDTIPSSYPALMYIKDPEGTASDAVLTETEDDALVGAPEYIALGTIREGDYPLVLIGGLAEKICLLTHELYIDGNPTTGSHSYDYTVDGSTDTLVFDYDDDATDIKSAFTSSSLGLSTTDLTVVGGPFPNVAAYVTFARDLTKKVSWPPVQNTVTLNNSAALKLRKSGG